MTSNAYVEVPASYDLDFIIHKLGWDATLDTAHTPLRGVRSSADGLMNRVALDCTTEQFEAFANAVQTYPVDYLAVAVPKRIAEAKAARDLHISGFNFNGLPVLLDLETKANITGSVSGLERNPQVAGIDWSLGGGNFIFLPRAMIFALADAAFLHIQACFTRFRNLVTALKAAQNIDALAVIDVTTGWPG